MAGFALLAVILERDAHDLVCRMKGSWNFKRALVTGAASAEVRHASTLSGYPVVIIPISIATRQP